MKKSLLTHIGQHMSGHGVTPTIDILRQLKILNTLVSLCVDVLVETGEQNLDHDYEPESLDASSYTTPSSLEWLNLMDPDGRRQVFQMLMDHGSGRFDSILKFMHNAPHWINIPWNDIQTHGDFQTFTEDLAR
jgi:hypothetical protein